MTLNRQTEMTDTVIDDFLAQHETGVLALAKEGEPYSIPISYGYDGDERTFFMRLVSDPDSEKRRFLSSEPQARLVIYEADDPIYRSVLASGHLEEISRNDLTVEHIEQFGEAKRPLFEIWGQPKPELDVKLYQLNPREMSGRRIEVARESESDSRN